MRSGKVIWTGLAVVWMLSIIAWPKSVYNAPSHSSGSQGGSSEGLYQSSLTDANFGILGFQLFESKDGDRTSTIRSDFAELRRKDNYVFMKNVDSIFFAAATGNEVMTVSQFGRSNLGSHLVDLEGEVEIRSKRGYLFEMDKMQYDSQKHEFHSKSFVKMRGPRVESPKMYLEGEGLLAHVNTEHFILRRQVTGRRRLSTNEWIRVKSRSGEFFAELQKAIFVGRSRAILPELQIRSDVFEMSVSDEKEFLNARGNVRLTHKGKKGEAERAFVEVGSDKVILDGKAKIDQNNNIIEGQRIVLYTDEDRVEVVGAEGRMNP